MELYWLNKRTHLANYGNYFYDLWKMNKYNFLGNLSGYNSSSSKLVEYIKVCIQVTEVITYHLVMWIEVEDNASKEWTSIGVTISTWLPREDISSSRSNCYWNELIKQLQSNGIQAIRQLDNTVLSPCL